MTRRGWTKGRYSRPDEVFAMRSRIAAARDAEASCRVCEMVGQLGLDTRGRCTEHAVAWEALIEDARQLLEERFGQDWPRHVL